MAFGAPGISVALGYLIGMVACVAATIFVESTWLRLLAGAGILFFMFGFFATGAWTYFVSDQKPPQADDPDDIIKPPTD